MNIDTGVTIIALLYFHGGELKRFKICHLRDTCISICIIHFIILYNFHTFVGNSQIYHPRCCRRPDALSQKGARPRAIAHRLVLNTEGPLI